MLDTIAWSEGTSGDVDGGYGRVVKGTVTNSKHNPPDLVGQQNVTITDFSHHPDLRVQTPYGVSSAAGRYQFLSRTWNGLGLPDFSPGNQDIGAVMLLERHDAIAPLRAGNFEQSVLRANNEWASLYGAPYGQRTRRLGELQNAYNQALANSQNQRR